MTGTREGCVGEEGGSDADGDINVGAGDNGSNGNKGRVALVVLRVPEV